MEWYRVFAAYFVWICHKNNSSHFGQIQPPSSSSKELRGSFMELFSKRRWNIGSAQQSNIFGVLVMVRDLWLKATKHRHTGNNARCKIGLLTFFNCEWEQSIRGKTYQMGRNLDLQSVSLGPIQPSSPSTKELHGSSGLSRSAAKTQWGSGLHWEEFQSFPIFCNSL